MTPEEVDEIARLLHELLRRQREAEERAAARENEAPLTVPKREG